MMKSAQCNVVERGEGYAAFVARAGDGFYAGFVAFSGFVDECGEVSTLVLLHDIVSCDSEKHCRALARKLAARSSKAVEEVNRRAQELENRLRHEPCYEG